MITVEVENKKTREIILFLTHNPSAKLNGYLQISGNKLTREKEVEEIN